MIALVVILGVAFICIDIKLNLSSKKIKLRKELQGTGLHPRRSGCHEEADNRLTHGCMKTSITIANEKVTVKCAAECGVSVTGPIPSDTFEASCVKLGWDYTNESTGTNPLMVCPKCRKKGLHR